jgi:hypothetical protein
MSGEEALERIHDTYFPSGASIYIGRPEGTIN